MRDVRQSTAAAASSERIGFSKLSTTPRESDGKEGARISVGRTTYPAADQVVARTKMPNISVASCDFAIGLWGVI